MPRVHEFQAWAAGLLPGHQPSRGELMLLAAGHGRPDPVAIVGVPVKR